MTTVAIVDDETLVRTGLELILDAAEDITVVGTASGDGALALVESTRPDVLLLDIRMPQIDGLTVLRQLNDLPVKPATAILTTFDLDEYVIEAMSLGAAGFLVKDMQPERLAQYVRALAAGGIVLEPRAVKALVPDQSELGKELDAEARRVSGLTERETTVLSLLAQGMVNAEIGRRLHLSAGTVKDHVSAVLLKLGVTNRVRAALAAQRAGLLDEPRAQS
jgi:DNA-binding NarL/FixJ family response regulator